MTEYTADPVQRAALDKLAAKLADELPPHLVGALTERVILDYDRYRMSDDIAGPIVDDLATLSIAFDDGAYVVLTDFGIAVRNCVIENARLEIVEIACNAPSTITIRFCPVCKRDNRTTSLCLTKHWDKGELCTGTPVDLTYRLDPNA